VLFASLGLDKNRALMFLLRELTATTLASLLTFHLHFYKLI